MNGSWIQHLLSARQLTPGAPMRKSLPGLLLLAVSLAVFLPIIGHDFLGYDDPLNIIDNPNVTEFSPGNMAFFWKGPYLKLYIPITYSFWGLLARVADLFPIGDGAIPNPMIFLTANLLIHLSNVVLVFLILKLILRHDRAAAIGTLLFAIHPVQVASVAWVTGLKDVFSGFWSLLALWQYTCFCRANGDGGGRLRNYLLASLFLVLALLSKPSTVTIPLMAGLIGALFFAKPPRRLLLELGPWLLAAIPIALLTQQAQTGAGQNFSPLFWQRLLIAGDALSFYGYKLLLPLRFGPDYGRTPGFVLQQGWIFLTGIIPYLVGVWCLWKGNRLAKAVIGIFLVGLLPVLGLVSFDFQQYSTVADRFLYLAILGPALGMGWLSEHYRAQPLFKFCLPIVLLLLAGRSILQVPVWKNDFTFYQNALVVNPKSWLAANNLGLAYQSQGNLPEASRLLEQAITSNVRYDSAYNNLGVVRHLQGRFAEAETLLQQALDLNPNSADAAANLGNYYYLVRGELDLARDYYLQAISNRPDQANAYVGLGDIAFAQGRLPRAIERYRQALANGVESAELLNNLGMVHYELGNYPRALYKFERADRLSPDQPDILFNLGRTQLVLGNIEPSRQAFLKALTVDEGFAPALAGLAKLYQQTGGLTLAAKYSEQARALGLDNETELTLLGSLGAGPKGQTISGTSALQVVYGQS